MPSAQPVCGECLRAPPPFAHAVAALDYAFPWHALIARFKFRGDVVLAPLFASLLVEAVRAAALPPVAWVLPMPLGRERLAERGYNQAWELARRAARPLRVRGTARVLRRRVDSVHQIGLPRDRRAANVRGVFVVDAAARPLLHGCDVALVDDVMTTGATAAEAARTLLDAGARSVQLWLAARTSP